MSLFQPCSDGLRPTVQPSRIRLFTVSVYQPVRSGSLPPNSVFPCSDFTMMPTLDAWTLSSTMLGGSGLRSLVKIPIGTLLNVESGRAKYIRNRVLAVDREVSY